VYYPNCVGFKSLGDNVYVRKFKKPEGRTKMVEMRLSRGLRAEFGFTSPPFISENVENATLEIIVGKERKRKYVSIDSSSLSPL